MSSIFHGMRRLLHQGEHLPTLPRAVFQLHNLLDSAEADAEGVTRIVEQDPALAARLLRAANHAAARPEGEAVGSVAAAVARLGVNQVRAGCIAMSVVRSLDTPEAGLDHQAFWAHSAQVGTMARWLWDRFGNEPAIKADEAYVAGLLHDTGLLILEQYFSREFAGALQLRSLSEGPLWQAEQVSLGMDHGAVGGLLLGRWSLPDFIVEAVSNHHQPHRSAVPFRRLTRVIHAAEVLCTAGGAGLGEEGPPDCRPADVLAALGASEGESEAIQMEVPGLIEDARAQQV